MIPFSKAEAYIRALEPPEEIEREIRVTRKQWEAWPQSEERAPDGRLAPSYVQDFRCDADRQNWLDAMKEDHIKRFGVDIGGSVKITQSRKQAGRPSLLATEVRSLIRKYHEEGNSIREIAEKTKIHRSSVARVLQNNS